MTLPLNLASLRADLKRELARLHARPHEGGPYCIARQGELLAFGQASIATVVTPEHVQALRALPDGAGAEKAREAMGGGT